MRGPVVPAGARRGRGPAGGSPGGGGATGAASAALRCHGDAVRMASARGGGPPAPGPPQRTDDSGASKDKPRLVSNCACFDADITFFSISGSYHVPES